MVRRLGLNISVFLCVFAWTVVCSAEGLSKTANTVLVTPEANDPSCKRYEERDCESQPKEQVDAQDRNRFDSYILEAANRFGIHPATLKALIHIESMFNPLPRSSGGNKGLCHMSAIARSKRPLEVVLIDEEARPSLKEVMQSAFNQPRKIGKESAAYSIWSPRGQILAAANLLRDLLFEEVNRLKVVGPQKETYDVTASLIGAFDEKNAVSFSWETHPLSIQEIVERGRFALVRYNQGASPVRAALRNWKVNSETGEIGIPTTFGQVWSVLSLPDVRSGMRFTDRNYKNGRCYVQKTMGLCGPTLQGYFGEYFHEFVRKPGKKGMTWQTAQ